jgi:hypothetical protein
MGNLFVFPTPSILLHVDAAILLSEQLLRPFDAALTISETSEITGAWPVTHRATCQLKKNTATFL